MSEADRRQAVYDEIKQAILTAPTPIALQLAGSLMVKNRELLGEKLYAELWKLYQTRFNELRPAGKQVARK
jgi:hypothetical protein